MVEQLFRKQQVFGSNPNVGSSFLYLKRAFWGDRSSRRIAFDSSFDSNPAQDTEVFEFDAKRPQASLSNAAVSPIGE